MLTQISILESQCKNLTESPLHALNGDQDLPQFFGIVITADARAPAWNASDNRDQYNQLVELNYDPVNHPVPTRDEMLQAALDSLQGILSHNFGNTEPGSSFEVDDSQNGSTFLLSETISHDPGLNPPSGLNHLDGDNSFGQYATGPPPAFSKLLNPYSPGADFAAMTQMLYGVDFTPWWNGQQIPIGNAGYPGFSGPNWGSGPGPGIIALGHFNRALNSNAGIGGNPPDGIFYAVGGAGVFPNLTGSSGFAVSSKTVGGLARAQVQVRNFIAHSPIEYNFYEVPGLFIANNPFPGNQFQGNVSRIFPQKTYAIARGGGQFTLNNQIVEVPAPTKSPGDTVGTPEGAFAVIGSEVFIAIGGPIPANYTLL